MVKPKLEEFERKLEDQNQKVKTIAEFRNFSHILNREIGTPEFYQNTYSVKLKKIENRIKCPLKRQVQLNTSS